MPFFKAHIFFFLLLSTLGMALAAQAFPADSWKTVSERKSGTVTVLWNEIEPFIYRDAGGQLIGMEYELMEGLKSYLKAHHGINLTLAWKEQRQFDQIYPLIRDAKQSGLFAVSYYSITPERKKEVSFTPAYMPDLNVFVSNNNVPLFNSIEVFKKEVPSMQGFTQPGTTMEVDLKVIRDTYFNGLPISYDTRNDYSVLEKVSRNSNAFAYVPVSIYVVALQQGIKVKRQRLFDVHREGFAAIFPKNSDWTEPLDQYFSSFECKLLVATLVRKYLGEEVAPIILGVSEKPKPSERSDDIDLLTKEREIVTQRLMKQAVELQKQQSLRNMILVVLLCLAAFAVLIYHRFRFKHRLNKKLEKQNQLISAQKHQIEQMNHLLQFKILQARMNPHFLFNTLNSIQYFILEKDQKISLQYISRFSNFLRKLIRYGDELMITVTQEAELIQEYLWLEQARFPERFDYTIKIETDAGALKTLPLLTHGLIEKALYSNILNLHATHPGQIDILFQNQEGHLVLTIRDNGMNRQEAEELNVRKGLHQIDPEDSFSNRVQLYNQQGENKITIHFEHVDQMNVARASIPQPLFATNTPTGP